jgi:hypothetical protein
MFSLFQEEQRVPLLTWAGSDGCPSLFFSLLSGNLFGPELYDQPTATYSRQARDQAITLLTKIEHGRAKRVDSEFITSNFGWDASWLMAHGTFS